MRLELLHQIWNDHAQGIYAYLLRLSKDREQSADLLQDVFCRLAQNDELLERIAPDPRGFLMRLAHNFLVDKIRRAQARERVLAKMGVDGAEPLTDAADPDLATLDAATTGALDRLPADQREVVYARLWRHLTFDEIALEAGISINTVASRFRYGISKMREELRDLYEGLQPGRLGTNRVEHLMKKPFHAQRGAHPPQPTENGAFEEQLIQPLDARRVPSASAGGLFEILPLPEEDDAAGDVGLVGGITGSLPVAQSPADSHGVVADASGEGGGWLELDPSPGEASEALPFNFDQVLSRLASSELFSTSEGPSVVLERLGAIFHSDPLAPVETPTLDLSQISPDSAIHLYAGRRIISWVPSAGLILPGWKPEMDAGHSGEISVDEPEAGGEKEEGAGEEFVFRGDLSFQPELNPQLYRVDFSGKLASGPWANLPASAGAENLDSGLGIRAVPSGNVGGGAEEVLEGEAVPLPDEAPSSPDEAQEPAAFLGMLPNQELAKGAPVQETFGAQPVGALDPWATAPVNEPHVPQSELTQAGGALPWAGANSPSPHFAGSPSSGGDPLESHGPSDDWSPLASAAPDPSGDEAGAAPVAEAPGTDFLPIRGEPPKQGWVNLDTVGVASVLAGVPRPLRRGDE
jgi:RNA polymerase sigma-70 factor (ECF subfamily)